MNVEIGAKAALFPEKEYINGIAVAHVDVKFSNNWDETDCRGTKKRNNFFPFQFILRWFKMSSFSAKNFSDSGTKKWQNLWWASKANPPIRSHPQKFWTTQTQTQTARWACISLIHEELWEGHSHEIIVWNCWVGLLTRLIQITSGREFTWMTESIIYCAVHTL